MNEFSDQKLHSLPAKFNIDVLDRPIRSIRFHDASQELNLTYISANRQPPKHPLRRSLAFRSTQVLEPRAANALARRRIAPHTPRNCIAVPRLKRAHLSQAPPHKAAAPSGAHLGQASRPARAAPRARTPEPSSPPQSRSAFGRAPRSGLTPSPCRASSAHTSAMLHRQALQQSAFSFSHEQRREAPPFGIPKVCYRTSRVTSGGATKYMPWENEKARRRPTLPPRRQYHRRWRA